jgi:glutathione S-transferase
LGAGYGVRPGLRDEHLAIYELYHVPNLWNWFTQTGDWPEQLPELEADLARVT